MPRALMSFANCSRASWIVFVNDSALPPTGVMATERSFSRTSGAARAALNSAFSFFVTSSGTSARTT